MSAEQNFFKPADMDMEMEMSSPPTPPKTRVDMGESKSEGAKTNADTFRVAPIEMQDFGISSGLSSAADEAISVLKAAQMDSFAEEIRSTVYRANREKFTVAVVGEFSRGKSTFINKMLGRDILPVSNMPTTAMLTRIRYSDVEECITVLDAKNKVKKKLPLSVKSWENYIASDDGNDPNGIAFVNIKSPVLKSGIEIIDTPGAGDLEQKRAMLIGDALKDSDGAIITISAQSVLSMSEKIFIEQRLVSNRTPFLMLILTKLDQIEKAQRSGIVKFVKDKLSLWNMKGIKVFIPYNVEMPTTEYDNIMGMDKVVGQLNAWVCNRDRQELTDSWTAAKVKAQLNSAIDYLNEKKKVASANEGEKKQLLDKKNQMLDKADKAWEEIKLSMLQRSDECYAAFNERAEEVRNTITEKLQYEMMHTGDVRRWWNEDFTYRMKVEMTNLSVSMENLVSRSITKDLAWLNASLERNFKTNVIYTDTDITDKNVYTNFSTDDAVVLNDLSGSKKIARLGMAAASITAAVVVCPMLGMPPIVGTLGIGSGGPMITEALFKKKDTAQREAIKEEIKTRVPKIISTATAYSQKRIKNVYHNIIAEATAQQTAWFDRQKSIVTEKEDSGLMSVSQLERAILDINAVCAKLERI